MTLATETASSEIYVGTGLTDTYAYPFKITADADLAVVMADESGSETTLTLTTDYTVTDAGEDAGGNVVLSASLALNYNLVAFRDMDYLQEIDLTNQEAYFLESLETGLDNVTMLIQQLNEKAERGVYKDVTDDAAIPTFTEIATYATDAGVAATSAIASAAASSASAALSSASAALSSASAALSSASAAAAAASATSASSSVAAIEAFADSASASAIAAAASSVSASASAAAAVVSADSASASSVSAAASSVSASASAAASAVLAASASTSAVSASASAAAALAAAVWIDVDPAIAAPVASVDSASNVEFTGSIINISGATLPKTGSYTVLTGDAGKLIILTSDTSASVTLTMDSVGASEDKKRWRFLNDSDFVLTVGVSDTDRIWNSGATYGIDIPDKGTYVEIEYDHDNTKFNIVKKAGGKVKIEGLVLQEPMNDQTSYLGSSTINMSLDRTKKHSCFVRGPRMSQSGAFNTDETVWQFIGASSEYCDYPDSPDWDIFGTQTGHKTVAFWVYHDAIGSQEDLIFHYEDASNYWGIYKTAANAIAGLFVKAGGGGVSVTGGAVAATTWTHVAMILNGVGVGIYLDGVQIAYDAAWTAGSLTGSLFIGQFGGGSAYLTGRMQDLHISYNNPYNAAPNVGVTDTFTLPAAPFQGVMK